MKVTKVHKTLNMTSTVHSQPRKAKESWTVSGAEGRGQGRGLSPSALGDPPGAIHPALASQLRKNMDLQVSPEEGHEDDQRNGAPVQ